jgi:hypothetical protein
MQLKMEDNDFVERLIFCDEATFHISGKVNIHNVRIWGTFSVRCPARKCTARAWETWTVAAADGVGCARVSWKVNFLWIFETGPFFCVYPVYEPV